MTLAQKVAAEYRKMAESVGCFARERAEYRAIADVVEAVGALGAPQACDGSGGINMTHHDEVGNEIGYEQVPCAGCCACSWPHVETALAKLAKAVGVEGEK